MVELVFKVEIDDDQVSVPPEVMENVSKLLLELKSARRLSVKCNKVEAGPRSETQK